VKVEEEGIAKGEWMKASLLQEIKECRAFHS
jgi:hypothetical protein